MSVSEDMENTDLLGLIFPDEHPGSGDLFLTEGNNLLDDLLSVQDVCNLHVQWPKSKNLIACVFLSRRSYNIVWYEYDKNIDKNEIQRHLL